MANTTNIPDPSSGELDILRILDDHKPYKMGEDAANMIDGGPNLAGFSPTDD